MRILVKISSGMLVAFMLMNPLQKIWAQSSRSSDEIEFIIKATSVCPQSDLPNIFLDTINKFQSESTLSDIKISSCNRSQSSNDSADLMATFRFRSFKDFSKWYNSDRIRKTLMDIKSKADQLQFNFEMKRSAD